MEPEYDCIVFELGTYFLFNVPDIGKLSTILSPDCMPYINFSHETVGSLSKRVTLSMTFMCLDLSVCKCLALRCDEKPYFFCEQSPAERVKAKMKLQLAETGNLSYFAYGFPFCHFFSFKGLDGAMCHSS